MSVTIAVESFVPGIQVQLKESMNFLNHFQDVRPQWNGQGDTISYSRKAGVAIERKTLTQSFTDLAADYGKDSLVMNEKIGRSFPLNVPQEDQNLLDTLSLHAADLADEILLEAQAIAYAALKAACDDTENASTFVLNADTTINWYKSILKARAVLKTRKVSSKGLALLINPDHEAEVLADPMLVRFDARGANGGDAIGTGAIGKIADITVYVSTQVDVPMICHSAALSYAFQYGLSPVIMEGEDVRATSDLYSIFNVFGCKANQVGDGDDVGTADSSPFIQKLVAA